MRLPHISFALGLLLPAPALAQAAAQAATAAFDTLALQGMRWRSIGPYRGGRVTAVAGVPSQPLVYYMGATGGGVWKTEDGGSNWRNVSDGFFRVGSIGAIAVADDDPNVLYVATGEAPVRGMSSSYGDGVYKSTDAGRTWTHVGLEGTRQVSRVIVHPRNSDVVYVAAQGDRWRPSADRGVFRSADGGRTWRKVHFVSEDAGPSDLAMDPTNPRVLYAAYWDHRRAPWRIRSGGPGSGIWKTTDGGETWRKLTDGLPTGTMGKIAVAVSAANPDRVFALVEADSGGLFRSDSGGRAFRRVSDDRVLRARAWYYINVFTDPQNPDVVYVLNAPFLKSVDGGRTFATIPTPHGDNHDLWINPRDPRVMINGNDGGANVSFNGGATWSTQMNQPTAQFYHVNTDARFPYWVYGAQQDNSTVATPSRTSGAGIDVTDWEEVGGCESAHIAFDPASPRHVYAGCYQGIIGEYDRETGLNRNVMAYPALGLGEPSDQQKYRFNWSAPILTSPHDRKTIYHAGNVVFRSTDRGQTWTAISPDLTRNEKSKQGPGGEPITNEGAGGEVYNTIFAMVESPHEAGVIWVGTDDGLVQLTRDGGKAWTNVTPRGLAEGIVSTVEVSPHDRATAYVAFTRMRFGDNAPHVYRTTDYGRTWTRLVAGLDPAHPVRVVREDPVRRGLLYAGTETGAYVSFDAGQRWQPLQLNLPRVPVTDLQVREGDLVASTEGRAFWILDDVSPLRQTSEAIARAEAHLYAPRPAHRVASGGGFGGATNVGANPPPGATLYYHLGATPDSAVGIRIEILDAAGQVVRTLTSRRPPAPAAGAPVGPPPPPPIPARRGLNRASWDLRSETATRVPRVMGPGFPGAYRVPAGTYTVRLVANGRTLTQPLEVRADPRLQVAEADARAHAELARLVHARVSEANETVVRLRDVRDQVNAIVGRSASLPNRQEIERQGRALAARIDTVESTLVQPRHRTFQDVINFRNGLVDQYVFLAEALDETDPPLTQGVRDRKRELDEQWAPTKARADLLLGRDLSAFNDLLREAPAVIVAPPKPSTSPVP